jgi:hypothetical protein
MTQRIAKSRQEPLGPDETFSALITRLISINRAERANRDTSTPTGPVLHRTDHQAPDPPEGLRART